MHALVVNQQRRSAVVAVALFPCLVIQVMNLLDAFDGAPPGVWIAVFTIQFLLLALMVTVSVVGIRRRGSRPRR